MSDTPPPGSYPTEGYSGQAGPPKTNQKAVWALVTGILGFFCGPIGIAGIVLGRSAQTEIMASGGSQQGMGLAKAGFIIGIVAVVLWIAYIILRVAVT